MFKVQKWSPIAPLMLKQCGSFPKPSLEHLIHALHAAAHRSHRVNLHCTSLELRLLRSLERAELTGTKVSQVHCCFPSLIEAVL